MNGLKRRSRLSLATITFLLLASMVAVPVAAQDRPAPAVEFAAGALVFPDDGSVTEAFVGGTARFYLLPRISLGPEVAYVSGDSHSHLMITGNVTVDLIRSVAAAPRRVVPFLVAGAGMFRTHEDFFDDAVTSSEGAFTAGAGIRGQLGRRVFVGAEARIGWETHIRLNGLIGVRLR